MLGPRNILEIAAGTGIATRELAQTLPAGVPITATDLNQPMIDRQGSGPVWQTSPGSKPMR